jgi:thiol-disulfide isomerase/thioredoxin
MEINFNFRLFDGAHAFLFTGTIVDDKISGIFYSNIHWKEPFEGKRNPTFELPSSNNITYLKEAYEKFNFSFPDQNGNFLTLEDSRFKGKVTVVQIMGSWCPNCLDETKFYTQYLQENPTTEVEFIALAFEISKTPDMAFKRINRLQERIGIKYPIVLAQYGSDNKLLANEKLPMLTEILSFPTSVFIVKKGNVRKIHTGFNGPATGQKYLYFKKEFEDFVTLLTTE